MNSQVPVVKGRLTLAALVLGSFILSLFTLYVVGRGGAIAGATAKMVITELLDIYLPLIAVMAAFYFGQYDQSSHGGKTSLEVFLFSSIVVGLWVIIPPLFIAFGIIEDVLATINILKPYGSSVAAAGVAFYFAKSGEREATSNNG